MFLYLIILIILQACPIQENRECIKSFQFYVSDMNIFFYQKRYI